MPGQRLRTFGDYTKPLNLKPRGRGVWQSWTWMAGGQLGSMEPQKLGSAVNKGVRTCLGKPKSNCLKSTQPGHSDQAGKPFKVPLAPPNWELEAGDWYNRSSPADPGQVCYCSSAVLGVESPRHCPAALSGGSSWRDQHRVQETSASTRAPLRGSTLYGRSSILPVWPPGTPGQPQRHLQSEQTSLFPASIRLGQNTSSLCSTLAILLGEKRCDLLVSTLQ